MDFAPQAKHMPKHYGQYAAVALLHIGLVYVLSVGLKTPFTHQPKSTTLVDVTPVPMPKEQPKDVVPKVDDVKLDQPKIVDFRIAPPDLPITPNVDFPPLAPPDGSPINNGKPAEGPVMGSGGGTLAKAEPASVGASCSNYGKVKDWLGDRFPVIADRSGFADRGITHFEMTVQLTISANGELLDQVVSDSTNAYAARAMQQTVTTGLHQLQCNGVGHSQTLRVPLSFTLTD